MTGTKKNIDLDTVRGFGDEWERFDQSALSPEEHQTLFNTYFGTFPWDRLSNNASGFDLGCGSGRWAKLVAPKVGHLHCIDPSSALEVARKNLKGQPNCSFHMASVDAIPLENASMDFGYSLGVLHHIPDTQEGLNACILKLKPGAPFLLYLYYAFDNRPFWFRSIWMISDVFRRLICRLPHEIRYWVCQCIAASIYYPLARTARLFDMLGIDVASMPLSSYRRSSFYTMRTDALDRFGTRLERRFTQKEILSMMQSAGLENITFSSTVPFWCALGFRRQEV